MVVYRRGGARIMFDERIWHAVRQNWSQQSTFILGLFNKIPVSITVFFETVLCWLRLRRLREIIVNNPHASRRRLFIKSRWRRDRPTMFLLSPLVLRHHNAAHG